VARKKGAGLNKSQAIREHLAKNPDASPKQIVEALAANGLQVTEGLASNVKYTSRHKVRRGAVAGRRRGRPPGRPPGRSNGGGITAQDLLALKQVVDGMGGVEAVRRALDMLEQLR
jgi:hypothetical protein